jgi:putative DNA primase/helicase
VAVGQAVQNELGEDGFSLWNEWSQGADNYNERAALDVWRSFGQGGGRTVATLFKRARGNGWTDDTKPAPMTQEEAEARRRSREEQSAGTRKRKRETSHGQGLG